MKFSNFIILDFSSMINFHNFDFGLHENITDKVQIFWEKKNYSQKFSLIINKWILQKCDSSFFRFFVNYFINSVNYNMEESFTEIQSFLINLLIFNFNDFELYLLIVWLKYKLLIIIFFFGESTKF